MPLKTFDAKIIKKEIIARNIVEFTFELNESIDYLPGNYALLSFNIDGKPISRAFTFTSGVNGKIVEMIIKKIGVFTTGFFELPINSHFTIKGPLGKIGYEKTKYANRRIIFVGAGTGITPIICILRKMLSEGTESQKQVKIFYSAKEESDLLHPELLKKHECNIFLTQETKPEYNHGRIDKTALEKSITKEELEKAVFFVCGPPVFEQTINGYLKELGAIEIINEL